MENNLPTAEEIYGKYTDALNIRNLILYLDM
jgi:hypothetical protein